MITILIIFLVYFSSKSINLKLFVSISCIRNYKSSLAFPPSCSCHIAWLNEEEFLNKYTCRAGVDHLTELLKNAPLSSNLVRGVGK